MQIKTISKIYISEGGRRLHEFALHQGDLDGACGPYSLMMALLLSDGLKRDKAMSLWNKPVDKRTSFAKSVKKLDALVAQGMSDEELRKLFLGIKKLVGTTKVKKLEMTSLVDEAKKSELNGLPLLNATRKHIDEHDKPVMLTLNWNKDDSHWVVAIGYQTRQIDGAEKLENILTLDPDAAPGRISPISAWNGVLGLGPPGSKKLRYTTDDGIPNLCTASQGLGFVNSSP